MSLTNPHQVTVSINSILNTAVDENRSLNINERFRLDSLFESLFKSDKSLYYSHYAAYAAFTGEFKGLDICADYFFSIKKENLNSDSIQCLYAMNNAAYFEKLYSILSEYDILECRSPEIIKMYFNAAVLTLNINAAEKLIHSVGDEMISDEQVALFNAMLIRAKGFLSSYEESMHKDLQRYIFDILKTHRKYIIPKIYKVAGPSILHPSFFNDEGRGYATLTLEYISEDVDFSMDLEQFFYDQLGSYEYGSAVRGAVSYGIMPVSPRDSKPFSDHVIEIGVF